MGLLKAEPSPRRHKTARTMKPSVRVIIEFLSLVFAMFVRFPPSVHSFFMPFYLAATSTFDVAKCIQHPDHLRCSRFHTPSRQAARTGSSTSEVCSSFPARTTFCRSTRTARRAGCPPSKHGRGIFQYHLDTPTDDFVNGPQTTSSFFGYIATPPSDTISNSSVFFTCRCPAATRTPTTPGRKPRPAPSYNLSF